MNSHPMTCVIAGGPVDCDMGVRLLEDAGLPAFALPAARDGAEQNRFQMLPEEQREAELRSLLLRCREMGAERVLVYCNSLSSAVNMPALSRELSLPIFTPLQIYGAYGTKYERLAALTGNGKALSGIEQAVLDAKPDCVFLGGSLHPLVMAVEEGREPEEIVRSLRLDVLMEFWAAQGVQAVILGCTHFPYVAAALQKLSPLPLLDPAQDILALLKK